MEYVIEDTLESTRLYLFQMTHACTVDVIVGVNFKNYFSLANARPAGPAPLALINDVCYLPFFFFVQADICSVLHVSVSCILFNLKLYCTCQWLQVNEK